MSQGGQGMFATEPAVTVIGSDGKMYGSPSAARAAGVYPEPESYNQFGPAFEGEIQPGMNPSSGVIYPNQPPSNGMTQYGAGGIGYPMGYATSNQPAIGAPSGGKGGGMFATEPAVTVIGSDGKMYGSPSAARAAGVYPEPDTYNQPVPMPGISAGGKGGGDPYSQRPMPPDFMPMPGNDLTPMPGISAGGKGGGDPYSQIMGQNGGGDPYSQIMGQMPTLQNPYATSTNEPFGGYDPRLYNNAFMGSNSRLNLSGLIGGGGGGGDATTNPFSDLTQAERAAYYSQNPNMGTITQLGQKALGFTSLGALSKAMNPGFWSEEGLIAMGINPAAYQAAKEGFRATEIAEMNAAAEQAAAEAAAAEATVANDIDAASATEGFSVGGGDSGYSGGTTGAGNEGGGIGAGEGLAQGGKVTKRHLKGPDPKGPDEGYGALLSGEYVIKKSTVNKYGTGLLDMINDGKIPAKKIKSLLG